MFVTRIWPQENRIWNTMQRLTVVLHCLAEDVEYEEIVESEK